MRYKIENLRDIEDAKNFINQYKASCSYKLLKYSMYLIVLTLFTIIIWSRFAKKDVVVNAFGVIDAKFSFKTPVSEIFKPIRTCELRLYLYQETNMVLYHPKLRQLVMMS